MNLVTLDIFKSWGRHLPEVVRCLDHVSLHPGVPALRIVAGGGLATGVQDRAPIVLHHPVVGVLTVVVPAPDLRHAPRSAP